ncbi:LysR family transcriptional regulator [Leisingera sp.]|uniref:LysR family transcriptional regulator n=1 Tax=Leisingera sp. TaxID=1879318 RepID=UPI002B27B6A1|nr:LysR family transcriptional regulator [Leisingera sp.]
MFRGAPKASLLTSQAAEFSGPTAAETELNIGRSSISKYIADLELRLDLKLCNRGPAGFSLTDGGIKVLKSAKELLTSVSDFRAEVNEIKQQMASTIRIALFGQRASNPEAFVPGGIRAFNKAAPSVEIELPLEPPNVIETKVIGGQLDIGILVLHRPAPSLDYMPLYRENMFLYYCKEHPFFDCDQQTLGLRDVQAMKYAGIRVSSPNLHVGKNWASAALPKCRTSRRWRFSSCQAVIWGSCRTTWPSGLPTAA